jgi:hypothetical protein
MGVLPREHEPWNFIRDFFNITRTTTLNQDSTQVLCNGCGILFSVPAYYAEAKERRKEKIYCPNGHQVLLGDKST